MSDESDSDLVVRAISTARSLVGPKADDWHEWRRRGLGASDIAGVLGLSPWASPWSVWARKVGLVDDAESEQTEAMEFGLRAEQMLSQWFMDKTGLWIAGDQTRCSRDDHPWMRCTVDGFGFDGPDIFDRSSAVCVVEWKTTGDSPKEWADAGVPLYYACQATWTSIVTGHPVVRFGVLHLAFGRPAFRVYDFTPTPDDVRSVTTAATRFWEEHVLTGVPPDIDASSATSDALDRAYSGDPDLPSIEATKELTTALDRIAANSQRIRDCQKVIDEQKNLIRAAMGDVEIMTAGVDAKGRPKTVATWKTQTRSAYFVEESSSRVLRIR